MDNRLRILFMLIAFIVASQGCKKDDSSTVSPPPPANSFSFSCSNYAFAASGPFVANATSGSGVGILDERTIAAYCFTSPTNGSIAMLRFSSADSIAVRSYLFPTGAAFGWALNTNVNDTAALNSAMCVTMSGTLVVTSFTATSISGTFSGTGCSVRNPTHTYSFANGAFTVSRTIVPLFRVTGAMKPLAKRMLDVAP